MQRREKNSGQRTPRLQSLVGLAQTPESTKCCSHLRLWQKKGDNGKNGGRLKSCVSQGQNKERPVGSTQGYQVFTELGQAVSYSEHLQMD